MVISGLFLVLVGALVVLVSELTARGRLGVNYFAGIRLPAIMESERTWTAGHRAARIPLDLGGAIVAAAGILIVALPLTPLPATEDTVGVIVIVAVGQLVMLVLVGSVLAHRAARAVR